MNSKKVLGDKNFYSTILKRLKESTNLSKIQKELNISKQNLNYYLRELIKKGLIEKKGKGWYEVTKKSKNSTEYGKNLPKDYVRGHAYVWTIKLPKNIENWEKRLEILKKKKINHILVGVLKDIPRIKVLGRKIWLCKEHLRIFDKKDSSYYGEDAIKARNTAFKQLSLILDALQSKLGIPLNNLDVEWKKEHYALIKNDLAIDHNKKGIVWRVKDKKEEWLLIDDSLEQGGELENVGNESFKTNLPMQDWWNDNKKHKFQVTPTFILNGFSQMFAINNELSKQISSHLKLIQEYRKENIKWRKNTIKRLAREAKAQTKLGEFF